MATYTWSIPPGKEITGSTYLKDTDNYIGDTINDLVDFVNGEGIHLDQGITYDFVDKVNDQTITGVKTFSGGIISNVLGNVTGNVTGNSDTSSKLKTARTISMSGDAVGSVAFDGSSNVNISVEVANDSHTHDTRYYTETEVDILLSNSLSPLTGMVIATARTSAPSGFLECNGASVSRTTYSNLFSAIGTKYGIGNGSTTFTLPDLRGEFIRGWDNGRGVDSARAIGSYQSDELKSHTHTFMTYSDYSSGLGGGGSGVPYYETTRTTSSTGGAETRPRNIAMMYCIKY